MKLEFLNMFWAVRNLENKREASIPKRNYIWREYLRPLFCENKVLNIRVRLQTILTKKGGYKVAKKCECRGIGCHWWTTRYTHEQKNHILLLLVNRMVVIPIPIPINIPIIAKITIQLLLEKQHFWGFDLTSTELSSSIFMNFQQKSSIDSLF